MANGLATPAANTNAPDRRSGAFGTLAAQLTQRWTQSVWRQAGILVSDGPLDTPVVRTAPPLRQRQRRLASGEVAGLLADYQSGLAIAAVARKYDINVKTATKHLKDNQAPIRSRETKIPKSEHPALLALKAAGWNNVQIAQHYGCTRQAVHLAFQRANKLSS